MSNLEGSKTPSTAFTVYILYCLLIFKNIFFPRPSSRVQEAPGILGGFEFYSHSIILVTQIQSTPAPLGVRYYVKF